MVFLFVFANQNSGPSSPFGFVGEVPTRSESSPAPADLPPRSVCLPRLGRGPELLGELVGALDRSFLGMTLNLQSEVRRLSRPEIPARSGLSTFNRVSFLSPSSPHLCVLCGENSSSFRSSLMPRHSPLATNSFTIRTYERRGKQRTYNSFRIRTYEKFSCKSFRIRTYRKVGGGGYADSLTQGRAPVASGGSLCSAYNSTFDFQLSTSSSVRMPGMWGEQQCHLGRKTLSRSLHEYTTCPTHG